MDNYSVFKVAEDCLKAGDEALKSRVDLLSSVLKIFHREERQQRIRFIDRLLQFGCDPNGHNIGQACPLDVVMELSKITNKKKKSY